jgi:carbon monoxide dehydrogenase subunit G
MAIIESNKVSVNASAERVYNFLSNMNNIQQLLPADKVSNWTSTDDACSFKVQGTYTIGLEKNGGTPHTVVGFKSGAGSPFPFDLTVHLQETNGTTEGHIVCDAQVNPFMEMIVKGPLKSLFDYMAHKLQSAAL